jgi:hypothetical protein
LAECDENSHSGYDPTCEYKRLQDVWDQIYSNTHVSKPLAVIRFNPYYKKGDVVMMVKRALEKALSGKYTVHDARGLEVVELIGYNAKRRALYVESGMMKRINI